MNNKRIKIGILVFAIIFGLVAVVLIRNPQAPQKLQENQDGLEEDLHPLSIEYMRQQVYPGSDITIEQTLPSGSNYNQYIASYKSDGLKIYALLTIPQGTKPKNGWPVIIFNHGFIPPEQYRTTERYVAYVDAFARNGYIVFKSDYRGHGNSEGKAEGGYGSNAYTIDVLNALSSMTKYNDADPNRIGMWGHSMGGGITLRSMVISKDIKAGVIWAGVVGSYSDLLNNWRRRNIPQSSPPHWATSWRQRLIDQYGEPSKNPEFWNSISANSYVKDISGPVQLHHAKEDSHVPFLFSQELNKELAEAGKSVEFYSYEGNDHNLTESFDIAMERSIGRYPLN
ncbi:peptidase [Candidatus Daviesbacteria bacterium RIFCSPHIGHO2_02_FULL_39_12]|uniref:Peptidase n=1 Tax=Candidatus Daviesbacteria bacterium RIFCSPHIGHO2_02_FULL_39_12 TaxID=1797770 RepID=A0A1F5J9K4_9BACT|nr:MAG: peptidase [Candidatus Daviesbacteria bacterium RIFCSPHIGHO2_02_FULL_39_12]